MKFKTYKCKRISRKHFDEIKITKAFKNAPPKSEKLYEKEIEFAIYKKLSPIIVDENMFLVDGYCAWIIADTTKYRGRKLKIYKAIGLDVTKKKAKK